MSKMKRAIEKFQIDIKMKRLDLHLGTFIVAGINIYCAVVD